MEKSGNTESRRTNRRAFLRTGVLAAGAATVGGGLLTDGLPVFAQEPERGDLTTGITRGDVAILTFLAAAESIESDLWIQYNELGGVHDSEVPGRTRGGEPYTEALERLDEDMPQYIHDNAEDELSHFRFIN